MANQGESKQPAPKQEVQPQPHATMELLSGVQYCVNSPPPWSKHSLLLHIYTIYIKRSL